MTDAELHLVLSSLHTNDAVGAALRLLNMGLDSFIVASALRLVVAQRLVRGFCKECKVPLEIDVDTHPLTVTYDRLHHHGRVTIRTAGETSLAEVLEHTVAADMPVAVPA